MNEPKSDPQIVARKPPGAALLVIDMINDFEFPDGERILPYAEEAAQNIASLKARARREAVPVVYVNDNFGKWRSDFAATLEHCMDEHARGRQIATLLAPDDSDYFVLKPKHSGFYQTTLELLLKHLKVNSLILTGVSADSCVLFTAAEAYMRDYRLAIPADCVASFTDDARRESLRLMERTLRADVRPSVELEFYLSQPENAR